MQNGSFDQAKYNEDVFRQAEQSFTFDRTIFPITAKGSKYNPSFD